MNQSPRQPRKETAMERQKDLPRKTQYHIAAWFLAAVSASSSCFWWSPR
jgi:hypothetical protein